MGPEKRTVSPKEARRGWCWLRFQRVPGKQEELITGTKRKSLRAMTEAFLYSGRNDPGTGRLSKVL